MLFVERDAVEFPQVEQEPAARKSLAPHAVLLPRARDFQLVLTGILQRIANVILAFNVDDAVNGGLVEVTGIIGKTAGLLECNRRGFWLGNENGRFFLLGHK